MKVDFNVLRKNIIKDYNHIVRSLNQAVVEDEDMNRVVIPVTDLKRTLDTLRNGLITLGCLFEPNDPECSCILSDDTKVEQFVPEE